MRKNKELLRQKDPKSHETFSRPKVEDFAAFPGGKGAIAPNNYNRNTRDGDGGGGGGRAR